MIYSYVSYCIYESSIMNLAAITKHICFREVNKNTGALTDIIIDEYVYFKLIECSESAKHTMKYYFSEQYLFTNTICKYDFYFAPLYLQRNPEILKEFSPSELERVIIDLVVAFHHNFLYAHCLYKRLNVDKKHIYGAYVGLFVSCISLCSWGYILFYSELEYFIEFF